MRQHLQRFLIGCLLLSSLPVLVISNILTEIAHKEGTMVAMQGKNRSSPSRKLTYLECRRTLVSTKINPPDSFPGYGGFNGWQDIIRLKNGDLLLGFCAGYWHVSFPTPYDIPKDLLLSYQKGGFPVNHKAPRGGRIMFLRSTDNGLTWTKPRTLVDTPWDEQEPSFNQLPDGTLVLNFFVIADWYGYKHVPKGKRINH